MLRGPLCESLPENALVSGGGAITSGAVLLVDSDPGMLHALQCYFVGRGFAVATARNAVKAREQLAQRNAWSLVLADFHLPDGNGADLGRWIRTQLPRTQVWLMSGSPDAPKLCAGFEYFTKPFPLAALEQHVLALVLR